MQEACINAHAQGGRRAQWEPPFASLSCTGLQHPPFLSALRTETLERRLTFTKISGQFSSSSYAAMRRLQASTDTRLFPLALKLTEASLRKRLHRAWKEGKVTGVMRCPAPQRRRKV